MILIYILVTALGSAAVLLWITTRRSAEVQTSLMAVHELRVRAWRKRVQAAETDGPEAETFALEAATLGRRAYDALQDLRAEYQEGGHFADDAFDGSIEEEMEALTTLPSHVGRDPAAADEARRHLARASHDAAVAARARHGRTQWRVPATQAPVGALVGAA
jgi:alpha-D-ribose 1-methylphosphonate 5-triphosphate diphosphatase PhnM